MSRNGPPENGLGGPLLCLGGLFIFINVTLFSAV